MSFPKHSDFGSAVLLLLPVLATPRAYSVSLPGSLKNPPTLTLGGISPPVASLFMSPLALILAQSQTLFAPFLSEARRVTVDV